MHCPFGCEGPKRVENGWSAQSTEARERTFKPPGAIGPLKTRKTTSTHVEPPPIRRQGRITARAGSPRMEIQDAIKCEVGDPRDAEN